MGVLQLRLKGADAKNKDLLKGLNENLAMLRAIPNGVFVCVFETNVSQN